MFRFHHLLHRHHRLGHHTGLGGDAATGEPRASLGFLFPIYTVIFFSFFGYATMVTLFVPMLMGDHGFVPSGTPRGTRTLLSGLLLAMYPLGQFLGSPVVGTLSDRHGRKPVLLTSLAITALCYAGIALSLQLHLLPLVFVACLVCGLAESNITVAQSVVADVAPAEERGRLFGFIYVACSVGYVLGPIVGGLLVHGDAYDRPFWTALALIVAAWLLVAVRFRETHPGGAAPGERVLSAFRNLTRVFVDRPIRRVYLANFLFYMGAFGLWRVILIYWVDEWDMPVALSTKYYAVLSGSCLLSNLLIMPWLSRKLALKPLTIGTALVGGALTAAIVIPAPEWSAPVSASVASAVVVLATSGCGALLSSQVGGARQGAVMGNNQALQVAAEALAATAGGALAALWVPLPILSCALVILLAAAVWWGHRLRHPADIAAEEGAVGP